MYYNSLPIHLRQTPLQEMKARVGLAEKTYCMQYNSLTNCIYSSTICDEFLTESKRLIISKWRLSCHKLRIEICRYDTPKTPRKEHTYKRYIITVDEFHVLFDRMSTL